MRRAKLFVFLCCHRHELFGEQFQAELAQIYADRPKGQPPVPPAQLALAVILQAYTGVSDDEVIEATVMDRRWQLVLDCLDEPTAPFVKGTLVVFRARMIEANLDRRLIERTIQIAQTHKDFGPRALRAALDSSPLWGAGRVEDTYNLLGHALRKAPGVIARQQGRGLTDVAEHAGTPVLACSSLKEPRSPRSEGGWRSGGPLAIRTQRLTAKVARLAKAGTTVLRIMDEPDMEYYGVVLQDPEGNEFCVA